MSGVRWLQSGKGGRMYLNRREFVKRTTLGAAAALTGLTGVSWAAAARKRPNVLFIAIDDLNDWVGCLGGHPQAKTPNIDKLARKGTVFEQAYCAAPLCNPSRTSLLTGLRPSTSGIYCNNGWFREHPKWGDWVTMPQYFHQQGYAAWQGGKVFHHPAGRMSDPASWDQQYSANSGTPAPPPERRFLHGMKGKFKTGWFNVGLDWAALDVGDEGTGDWKTADLAGQFLQQNHEGPFFLACGIFRPHLPWYAPRKYFDLHPLDQIILPPYKEDDLDDVPAMGRRLARPEEAAIIKASGQWKNGVQGYLACGSFADACVGHVLDALENSAYGENTIVVLWGDHGFNLGQKDHWEKYALWEETSRTPLIIHAPGVSPADARCKHPVSLVDIYPTLIELCGLPERKDLDGRSLAPLVAEAGRAWPHPAVMTHWQNNHAIRDDQYRYIHYRDGGEELYDHQADPYEWTNLAHKPECAAVKEKLAQWLPRVNAEHFQPEAPENM